MNDIIIVGTGFSGSILARKIAEECGRLAEFKYYNMDVCIEHALEKFEEIKGRIERA